MVGEETGERLPQRSDLAAHAAARHLREQAGSRCPAIIAASISRPDAPKMSEVTFSAVLAATRPARSG